MIRPIAKRLCCTGAALFGLWLSLPLTIATAMAAPVSLPVAAGEISFQGTLRSVDAANNSLVMDVVSFTLPNGKQSTLAAPKPKTITLDAKTIWPAATPNSAGLALANLKAGAAITIVAADLGGGKIGPARRIAMETSTVATAPVASAVAASAVAAVTVPVGRAEFELQIGHSGSVRSIAYAPDGRLVATGGLDRTVKLWDVASGALVRTLSGHLGGGSMWSGVRALAWSPDGKTLASGAGEAEPWQAGGEVKLWDVTSGALRHTLKGDEVSTESLVFSPDGAWLISGGRRGELRAFEVQSGVLAQTVKAHDRPMTSLVLSPDGRNLASGAMDKTIKLWDIKTLKLTREFASQSSTLSLAWSPDGKTLGSGGGDYQTRLWDVESGQIKRAMRNEWTPMISLSFSPDGQFLVAGRAGGSLLWDVASGEPRAPLPDLVAPIAFSPDGSTLAGAQENDLALLDTRTATVARVLHGTTPLRSARYSPDGSTLAVVASEGIQLWDARNGSLKRTVGAQTMRLRQLAWSPDGKTLASSSHEKGAGVTLWNAATGALQSTLKGNAAPITAVNFSPDGEWLAGAGRDGIITLWNVAEGAIRHSLSGHSGEVESVAFSPDGTRLASGGGQEGKIGELKVWDVESGKALWSSSLKDRAAYSVAWLGNATLATAAYGDGEGVQLWDEATGKVQRTLSGMETRRPVWAVAVSPDGSMVAAVGIDGLRLWDAKGGQLLWKSPFEYSGYPTSVQFAPDGKTLVTCGFDGRLQVWSFGAFGALRPAATLLVLPSPDKPGAAPATIAFTPEGFYVASPAAESAVRFRVGSESFPAERFQPRFKRADALQAALSGQAPLVPRSE